MPGNKSDDTCFIMRVVASLDELKFVYDILGAQFTPTLTHNGWTFEDLANHYPEDRQLMLVIEKEGNVIGGALGFDHILRIIAVTQAYRGVGLGRRLIQTFEVAAMRKGLRMVSLGSHPDAIDFYTKMGYRGNRGRSKELPLPGKFLEYRLRKWEETSGDLEVGQRIYLNEEGKIPSLF
jgi:predicted N-acetyltransferase YhbS